MKIFSVLALLLSFVSCAHVQSVSVTQIPAQKGKVVQAEVSKFMFLMFNFNNDYVDELTEKLRDQCKGGKVEGILTKHEGRNYILFFDSRISAKGYCNKGERA